MFQAARLRLTAWYLLIIMCVSALFSLVIYTFINHELSSIEIRQQIRLEKEEQAFGPMYEAIREQFEARGLPAPHISREMPELANIERARARTISALLSLNLAILGISGLAGYFLAGRTLKPIKDMVDDQNRFISDASHELRTPLTSLRAEMEVSLLDKKLTSNKAKAIIASNLEEVIHLQTLSDSLLELTQYEKAKMSQSFEEFDLYEVILESIKSVQGKAKQQEMTITTKLHHMLIKGNKQMIRELFVILLDNAIKYSLPKTEIIITAKKTDHSVLVTVTDQGIGIPEKDLAHIFDRFYRAEASRNKHIGGYGLGLSIAKKIVTLHKGTISVKSKANKGTTFTVRLSI